MNTESSKISRFKIFALTRNEELELPYGSSNIVLNLS